MERASLPALILIFKMIQEEDAEEKRARMPVPQEMPQEMPQDGLLFLGFES